MRYLKFAKYQSVAGHEVYSILWRRMLKKKIKKTPRHTISYYEHCFIKKNKLKMVITMRQQNTIKKIKIKEFAKIAAKQSNICLSD